VKGVVLTRIAFGYFQLLSGGRKVNLQLLGNGFG
jgi:hypothetical protein